MRILDVTLNSIITRKGYPLWELEIPDVRPCYLLPLPILSFFKEILLHEEKVNHNSANYRGESRGTILKSLWGSLLRETRNLFTCASFTFIT